jgi:uncharacterized glyoxalase superfamily protein PhnB
MTMTDSRNGPPGLCPTLLYADARAAVRQLTQALGFRQLALYEGEDGAVAHAELTQGGGVVMLGSKDNGGVFAEAMRNAGPAGVYVAVEDVDAHHARAVEHGVEILTAPADQDYGSRDYMARDLEGNVWSFGTYTPVIPA